MISVRRHRLLTPSAAKKPWLKLAVERQQPFSRMYARCHANYQKLWGPTHWGFVLYEFDKNQWMASFTKMISWDATFDFFIYIQILNYVALQSSTKHCGLKVEKLSKDEKNAIGCKIHLCMTPKQLRWNNKTNFLKELDNILMLNCTSIISPLCKDLESS